VSNDREVGKAFISLRAEESKLRTDVNRIRSQVQLALREINRDRLTIPVDTRNVDAAIKRVQLLHASLQAINRQSTTIVIRDNADTARLRMLGLSDQLKGLPKDVDIRTHVTQTTTAINDLQKVHGVATAVDRSDPNVRVSADTREAESGLNRVLGIVRNIAIGIGAGFLLSAVTQATKQITTFAVSSVAAFEQVQVSFEGLFHSEPVANAFIEDLQTFAAKTPFEFDTLTSSAQRLLGTFGRGFREDLIPTLTAIGDVAASLGQTPAAVDRVVLAISQIQGKGKVQLEELNQIREALPGFNAVQAIADGMGLTVQEATAKISKGSISATDAIAGLLEGMRQFPGAAGAMERQSATLNGRISTLKDNMLILTRGAFTPLAGAVGTVVDALGSVIKAGGPFEDVFAGINGAITKIVSRNGPAVIDIALQLAAGFGQILDAAEPLVGAVLPLIGDLIEPLAEIMTVLTRIVTVFVDVAGEPLVAVFGLLADVITAIPIGVLETLVNVFIALKVGAIAAAAITAASGAMAGLAALAGPIGLFATAAAGLYLVLRDDGPTEQEKALSVAVDGVAVALEKQLSGLTQNSVALQKITEDGTAAAEAQRALNDALAGITQIEIAPVDGKGITKSILDAVTLGTLSPDVAGGVGLLGSTEEAFGALGVTAEKTLLFLERVRSALKTGGKLDVTGLFPTEAQGKAAQVAFEAYADGQETANIGTQSLVRQVEAFNTLVTAGVTDDTVFKQIGDQTRIALEQLALVDPIAAQVLADGDAIRANFGTTQADLDAFLVEYAEKIAEIEKIAPVTDFSALIKDLAAIADPSERAAGALKAMNEQLARLNGTKIDVREATAAVEALFDQLSNPDESFFTQDGAGVVTLDLTVEPGRINAEKLASSLATIKSLADAQFAETGNPLVAEVFFNANINQLRDEFVKEGGTLDEFNAALNSGAYGPNEVQYKAVIEEQTKIALQAEITNIGKSSPAIEAALQVDLDAGRLDVVQKKLDFLTQLNEGGYIVNLDPNVEDEAADAAAQELALLAAVRDVGISPEMDKLAKSRYLGELEEITGVKYVTIHARTSGFAGVYDAIRSFTPQEMGGIWRAGIGMAYEAGGFSHIQSTPPHMITNSEAQRGPYYMYGEPSTHGEAFISMAPKWRDRTERIWTDVGNELGFLKEQPPAVAAVATDPTIIRRLEALIAKVGAMAEAMAMMPPITVQGVSGSVENAAAKLWYAQKARLTDAGQRG